ncbi:hypothetical protein INT43_001972 [Umbelopsis isabellina]|uniref:N-acetyltransferase domain-containing protein n=1 Tax=Mortierella isabellina TaxID=91625 RepID=A0A8H7UEX9_MORIS|nr:hypothetical protein INT43_001972 [Umbelopsis isabellina]
MARGLQIRQCTLEEAKSCFYEWAKAEQWNPGLEGAELQQVYYPTDSQGFFVGSIEDPDIPGKEKIISAISSVRYGLESGWVGYYLVHPKERSKGYGHAIFKHAILHMGDRPHIGLDAVIPQVHNYEKSGFTSVWENQRRVGGIDNVISKLSSLESLTDVSYSKMCDVPIDQINDLEFRYNGFIRPKFIQNWVEFHSQSEKLGRFGYAIMDHGRLVGYGCARAATTSFRVGPIFAESLDIAKALLYKLATSVKETMDASNDIPPSINPNFEVDICAANPQAVSFYESLGMSNALPTKRMWKGQPPKVDIDGIYALSTLELG